MTHDKYRKLFKKFQALEEENRMLRRYISYKWGEEELKSKEENWMLRWDEEELKRIRRHNLHKLSEEELKRRCEQAFSRKEGTE